MTIVPISGWHYGFQKVEFARLMKGEMGMPLCSAKTSTDRTLDGDPVELEVLDGQVEHLLETMTDLGDICEVAVPQR